LVEINFASYGWTPHFDSGAEVRKEWRLTSVAPLQLHGVVADWGRTVSLLKQIRIMFSPITPEFGFVPGNNPAYVFS